MRRDDDGFTLIELMVVVLIIAILLAIAIPTFLGARGRANDRAAQSNVRNAHVAELVHYTDSQTFTADEVELRKIDGSFAWTTTAADMALSAKHVFVHVGPADTVILGTKSASGDCFWLRAVGEKDEPRFAKTDCVATPPAGSAFTDAW